MSILNHQEQGVIIFLSLLALLGVGADFLAKKYTPAKSLASWAQDLGKVDLNSADKEALMSIPGIGEKIAGRILEYRRQKGDFKSPEELKNIKGVTGYRYQKFKEYLWVK